MADERRINSDQHYCKHCLSWFSVDLGPRFSGDVFLECPTCHHKHYRHFALGEAVHCSIEKRYENPRLIKGTFPFL